MSDSDASGGSGVQELYFGSKLERESVQDEEKERPPRDVIHVIFPKSLSKNEAGRCLCHLGKPVNGSGLQLAYIMIKANDMKLTDIDVIKDFKYLHFVDVSGNFLRGNALWCLEKLEYLLILKANDNRLQSSALPKLPYLQVLCLNKNKITEIAGIEHPKLRCLELNYNKLTEVVGLNPFRLRELAILELRGNSLINTNGIFCPALDTLILCENLIEELVGLQYLTNLRLLHLRDNPLSNLSGFSETMTSLKYLNLRSCEIRSIREIEKLRILPCLETLVLWDNPIIDYLGANYRLRVILTLPHIKRIDKGVIRSEELHFADLLSRRLEMGGEYGEGEELGETTFPETAKDYEDEDD